MTGEPRDRRSGETMSEIIVQFGNELESDAVWTWQLVSSGRQGFGVKGDALADFMRRCIKELLSRGALPVYGGGGTPYHWIVQRQYGTRPEEILDNVMAEWLADGAQHDDPGELWFALPERAWTPPE
jgi:hypothetical protein